ncbi:MAG: sulfurtransferase [Methylobacterium sp.]|nr:MAG: sulfurtransferase [Methylobacterium sp.]
MTSPIEISIAQFQRQIGTRHPPIVLDVRIPEDIALDPRRLPTAEWRDFREARQWASLYRGQDVVVICQKGLKLSQGVAALIRHAGGRAESLEGGFEAWREAGGLLVRPEALPAPQSDGATLWVTRMRPKIDRIACPWLIRRFVDPRATFLFVTPGEVVAVAERFGATPFDVEDVFWSHRGELCTFDIMVQEFGLSHPPLDHLARIIRAADTATLKREPEAAGLLALSLGLSRLHRDDLAQLEEGMLIYDALYRWCRDAVSETHNWPNPGRRA